MNEHADSHERTTLNPRVGAVVRPAYGGAYRGVVTYVSRVVAE
jgi:hypothetical protein